MQIRRDIQFGIGVLIALQVLTAFGAIGLFVRMSPVIERIMADNVYSIEAAEDLLEVVATSGHRPASEASRGRFADALARLRANVTEPEEVPNIDRIEAEAEAVLQGDARAIREALGAIDDLVAINRGAMRRVDEEARRLGAAGAWSVVFLTSIAFAASTIVVRRMRNRLLDPLAELYAVLEAHRQGDGRRRCRPAVASQELRRVMESINLLLDALAPRETTPRKKTVAADRAALLHLLDERPEPTVVIDDEGRVHAANALALERLAGPDGDTIKRSLERTADGASVPEIKGITPIEKTDWRLCVLAPGEKAPAG